MTTLTFIMQDDGKLPVGIRETLAIKLPEFAGKKMRFTFVEAKDKRSLDQNAYYWGVIVPHVRNVRFENGDPVSEETVHEDLLYEFAPRVEGRCIKTDRGKRPMRSKEMSVAQFADYVTAITAAMAAFGNPIKALEYA